MTNTPLNPDALEAAAKATMGTVYGKLPAEEMHVAVARAAVSAYLAVDQPVVNSFDPRELNRRGWTCGCEPGDYDECDDCLTAAHELANFLNRTEVKP